MAPRATNLSRAKKSCQSLNLSLWPLGEKHKCYIYAMWPSELKQVGTSAITAQKSIIPEVMDSFLIGFDPASTSLTSSVGRSLTAGRRYLAGRMLASVDSEVCPMSESVSSIDLMPRLGLFLFSLFRFFRSSTWLYLPTGSTVRPSVSRAGWRKFFGSFQIGLKASLWLHFLTKDTFFWAARTSKKSMRPPAGRGSEGRLKGLICGRSGARGEFVSAIGKDLSTVDGTSSSALVTGLLGGFWNKQHLQLVTSWLWLLIDNGPIVKLGGLYSLSLSELYHFLGSLTLLLKSSQLVVFSLTDLQATMSQSP